MQKRTTSIWPAIIIVFASIACSHTPSPTAIHSSATPLANTATVTTPPVAPEFTQTPQHLASETTADSATETQIPAETPTQASEPNKSPAADNLLGQSGLRVVYTHESNLWLWQEGSSLLRLTDSYDAFSPIISPDGMLVAYRKGWDIYNSELWVVNINGSDNRILVSQDDLGAIPRDADALATMIGDFGWVPGKHTIAYNTIPLYEGPGTGPNNDLRLVDADSGEQSLLFEAGQGGEFTYALNGDRIALVTPETLSIVDADGSNRQDILTFPLIYTYGEWNFYPQPVWSPDSSYLRIAVPPQDALASPNALTLVWHIPTDGSMPYMAGEFVAAPAYISAPLISPDTKKVIYLAPVGEAFEIFDLWLLDLTNGNQTPIHIGNLSLHNWNPDSTRYVFSQNFGAKFFVAGVRIPPEIISDVPVKKNIEWISAHQFIFTSGENEDWELRIGALGEGSTLIAQAFGEFFSFDFYPKP